MDLNYKKELFSEALCTAVCAQSGCTWSKPKDFGIDLHLEGVSWKSEPTISVQLKSTADLTIVDEEAGVIRYPLNVKNYKDLIKRTFNPRILVLALVPKSPSLWVKHSISQVSMQYGIYWLNLKGMKDTQNSRSVTVAIPIENRFDSQSLQKMMRNMDMEGQI